MTAYPDENERDALYNAIENEERFGDNFLREESVSHDGRCTEMAIPTRFDSPVRLLGGTTRRIAEETGFVVSQIEPEVTPYTIFWRKANIETVEREITEVVTETVTTLE